MVAGCPAHTAKQFNPQHKDGRTSEYGLDIGDCIYIYITKENYIYISVTKPIIYISIHFCIHFTQYFIRCNLLATMVLPSLHTHVNYINKYIYKAIYIINLCMSKRKHRVCFAAPLVLCSTLCALQHLLCFSLSDDMCTQPLEMKQVWIDREQLYIHTHSILFQWLKRCTCTFILSKHFVCFAAPLVLCSAPYTSQSQMTCALSSIGMPKGWTAAWLPQASKCTQVQMTCALKSYRRLYIIVYM